MQKSNTFKALNRKLSTKHFYSLTFHYYPVLNTVELEVIVVKEEYRRQGYGSRAMQAICDLCDETETLLVLYPSHEFGTPKSVLNKFYSDFGFRYQRKKDYQDRYRNFLKRNHKPKLENFAEMFSKPEFPLTVEDYKTSIDLHLFPKTIKYETKPVELLVDELENMVNQKGRTLNFKNVKKIIK